MKISKYKIWILISLIIVAALISVLMVILKNYKNYFENNPPITISQPEKCTVSGLVGYWKFDEINTKLTTDSSGLNHHGSNKYWLGDISKYIFGEPVLIKGMDGNGLAFKGRQWISAGNNSCFVSEQFTISVWVWQDSDYVQDPAHITHNPWPFNVPTIMAKGSWPYDGWWLCSTTADVDGKLHYRDIDIGIAWGDGFTHIKSGYQLPLKEWHHIVVTMDNIKHEAQFYIDGKVYGSKQTGIPKWLINWNHDMFLGDYDGSGRWLWIGKLDDMRYYNKVISDDEAIEIFVKTFHDVKR